MTILFQLLLRQALLASGLIAGPRQPVAKGAESCYTMLSLVHQIRIGPTHNCLQNVVGLAPLSFILRFGHYCTIRV
jgi:hypothetical protein